MRKAIIFTAPSGSGKTTLVKHVLENIPSLVFSISATTRQPRPMEVDGKDYYFLSVDDFRKNISEGNFIEWEEVYPGAFYGTLKLEIERIWSMGKDVIFDVEVHGATNLKKHFAGQAMAIFVKVPDIATLQKRLEMRETETPESLGKRVKKAEYELTFEPRFDLSLLNDDLEKAKAKAVAVVKEFLS